MIKRNLLAFILILFSFSCLAQDIDYARELVAKLAGKDFYGRGYVHGGDSIAAEYIAAEFYEKGLIPVDSSYFQEYYFPINTFPGKIKLRVDGHELKPGFDYVISSSNHSIKGKFNLFYLPDSIVNGDQLREFLNENELEDHFLVSRNAFKELYGKELDGVSGIILLTKTKPFWHVSNADQVSKTCWIKIDSVVFSSKPNNLRVHFENEFIPNHKSRNVFAVVRGKSDPDKYVAITSHYDHLGMMGSNICYPGANDNASGTAMMMDLARHFAKPENQPEKSMVFMAFSGEEAGLRGASYYVENPLFRLERIDLLVNLDMVGTGSEGITIVNSLAYKELYDKMIAINQKEGYVPAIKKRGEACNSDHCPFYERGIQSIFIYTMGKEHTEYHTPDDLPERIPFTAYEGLFRLIRDYITTLE
ncbi:MAG: M28 family peptidase [bacterium]